MQRRQLVAVVVLAATAVGLTAFLAFAPGRGRPVTVEERVYSIASELRCPVCDGQTVAESNQRASLRMRRQIRAMVEAGRSRQEILDYFVGRWGRWILARPPMAGIFSLVWLLPLFALAGGSWLLWRSLGSKAPPPAGDEATAGSDAEQAPPQPDTGGGEQKEPPSWIERRVRRLL